ncbi:Early nodulin-like protein 1 [Bienertia sinuspersici]
MSSNSLIFLCIFALLLMHGTSTEFEVGETLTKGWGVPPAKDPQVYNQWAQKNRFKVNDTLHFKYKKDSVMLVTDPEYDKCRSTQPLYFANNGDTSFVLDRPGLFYFISGVSGHCERGQKMIVKVLDIESPPAQSQDQTAAPDQDANDKNDASTTTHLKYLGLVILFIVGFFMI